MDSYRRVRIWVWGGGAPSRSRRQRRMGANIVCIQKASGSRSKVHHHRTRMRSGCIQPGEVATPPAWRKFEVVSDHIALNWLLRLAEPRARLARWIVCIQRSDFVVRYAPGGGSLMVVPHALSRDTMSDQVTLCARCLETIGLMDEENDETSVEERDDRVTMLHVATMREA
jgi:hypothetical protein